MRKIVFVAYRLHTKNKINEVTAVLFKIEVWLIYNVLLVSSVQQRIYIYMCVCVYIYMFFKDSFPLQVITRY